MKDKLKEYDIYKEIKNDKITYSIAEDAFKEIIAEIEEANTNAEWWNNRYRAYQIINKDLRKSNKDLIDCLNNLLQLLDLDKKYVSVYVDNIKDKCEDCENECTDEFEKPRDFSYLDSYWRKGGTYVIPTELINDLTGEIDDLVDKINRILSKKS